MIRMPKTTLSGRYRRAQVEAIERACEGLDGGTCARTAAYAVTLTNDETGRPFRPRYLCHTHTDETLRRVHDMAKKEAP